MRNDTPFINSAEFYEQDFLGLDFASKIVEGKLFDGCKFNNSNFSESRFLRCKFIGCEFTNCDVSVAHFNGSTFNEVVFSESKVIGINWTNLNWPHIRLYSPLQFYKSIINHSSFYGLELKELILEACVSHDVDFRNADLSHANFRSTDFEQSQFVHTKLCAADLTEAYNYRIDPTQNDIRKAKFSLPDAMNLLDAFDIQIIS